MNFVLYNLTTYWVVTIEDKAPELTSPVEPDRISITGDWFRPTTLVLIPPMNTETISKQLEHRVQYPGYAAEMIVCAIEKGWRSRKFFLRVMRMSFDSSVYCSNCERRTRKLYGPSPETLIYCYSCLKKAHEPYLKDGHLDLNGDTPEWVIAVHLSMEYNQYIELLPR